MNEYTMRHQSPITTLNVVENRVFHFSESLTW
ncbi:hypothetical protein BMMGA3_17155 (plasmid) [Bacillus methanolicus MGA3]|uniref:Uncharacterized protein n=1 Tax=Bacillus methanolicus (strain MGA3 / ATCC 53907) TaxID=796606 RepID=A0A068LXW4_BACMM|nr:hypothetical protein BMMGA3_17155 [Bacillus methanolicus MGA3]